jgi:hypothetical protein
MTGRRVRDRGTWVLVAVASVAIVLAGCGGSSATPAKYSFNIAASQFHRAPGSQAIDVVFTIKNTGGTAGQPWCTATTDDTENSTYGIAGPQQLATLNPGASRTVTMSVPPNASNPHIPIAGEVLCASTATATDDASALSNETLWASAVLPASLQTTSPAPAVHSRPKAFASLNGESLPGLPSSNWPALASIDEVPPGATGAITASSDDAAYVVTFFDFSSPAAAKAFYSNPPGAMPAFLNGALAYTRLPWTVPFASPAQYLDMRACGVGVHILASGSCSSGGQTYSGGLAVILRRGDVVLMVGYIAANIAVHASQSLTSYLAAPTQSALTLLKTIG